MLSRILDENINIHRRVDMKHIPMVDLISCSFTRNSSTWQYNAYTWQRLLQDKKSIQQTVSRKDSSL